MSQIDEPMYDRDLQNWRSADSKTKKLRHAQKLLLSHPAVVDRIFGIFRDSGWLKHLDPYDIFDLVECSMGLDAEEGMTPRARGQIFDYLDQITVRPDELGQLMQGAISVKFSRTEMMETCTAWVMSRWGGTHLMSDYLRASSGGAILMAMQHPKAAEHLELVLSHMTPGQRMENQNSGVGLWTESAIKGIGQKGITVENTLGQLLHWGADIEDFNGKTGTSPLNVLCNSVLTKGLTEHTSHAIDLLLKYGARWQHLEKSVVPQVWEYIQKSPRVRSRLLSDIAAQERGGVDEVKNTPLPKVKM